jgi:hypothetical protein
MSRYVVGGWHNVPSIAPCVLGVATGCDGGEQALKVVEAFVPHWWTWLTAIDVLKYCFLFVLFCKSSDSFQMARIEIHYHWAVRGNCDNRGVRGPLFVARVDSIPACFLESVRRILDSVRRVNVHRTVPRNGEGASAVSGADNADLYRDC